MDRVGEGPGALTCAGDGACVGGGEAAGPSAEAQKKRLQRAKRVYERRDYLRKVAAVQRVCRRLEAGGTLTEACRDPTMPAQSTLWCWVAHEPELREMVAQAEARRAATFGPRRAYVYYEEAVATELLARLEHGRSLTEVCEELDMPAYSTAQRWLKEKPEFAAAYLRAREAQADRLFDLAWRIACEAGEDEVKTARLKVQAIKYRIARLAPRAFGPQKAAAPERAQAPEATGDDEVVFIVRRFGMTPDDRLLEITDLVEGLPKAEIDALMTAIRSGRLTAETLPPPPPWLEVESRLRPGRENGGRAV